MLWDQIQPGYEWPPPSLPGALVTGGVCAGAGRWAGLGVLLAGGVGVGVPRPVPIGAVTDRELVDVHALPCWDHSVPSKAVRTWNDKKDASAGVRGPQGVNPNPRWVASTITVTFYSVTANEEIPLKSPQTFVTQQGLIRYLGSF